ncbi:U4/U6.U5 small nuclear ribonucleoprotein 27 kDa protein isoform X2 [Phyllopteryx taeniolatus]|uniref:U4/U6.U5 small nuclear ribonucleoprotein 27 kDa protein isoform X2 n=1 Tax=Phyllopteryx taeniolatus TaxID=161469 RepID=UPI002AD39267|nr:U4/U6.U5 small nuclear ribonucleoprotein 27 kDa protein isoform X2 [Phyllopteryx taeniolatus]
MWQGTGERQPVIPFYFCVFVRDETRGKLTIAEAAWVLLGPEKTIKVATTVIQVTQSEDATTSLAVYVSLCRSPRRHRSSSLSPVRQKDRREDERKEKSSKPIQISAEDMQGKTEEEIEMMKLMGFATFDSTKGKKSEGATNAYAVNTTMKRKYRQYMNRKGGFNRPLDFIA